MMLQARYQSIIVGGYLEEEFLKNVRYIPIIVNLCPPCMWTFGTP